MPVEVGGFGLVAKAERERPGESESNKIERIKRFRRTQITWFQKPKKNTK